MKFVLTTLMTILMAVASGAALAKTSNGHVWVYGKKQHEDTRIWHFQRFYTSKKVTVSTSSMSLVVIKNDDKTSSEQVLKDIERSFAGYSLRYSGVSTIVGDVPGLNRTMMFSVQERGDELYVWSALTRKNYSKNILSEQKKIMAFVNNHAEGKKYSMFKKVADFIVDSAHALEVEVDLGGLEEKLEGIETGVTDISASAADIAESASEIAEAATGIEESIASVTESIAGIDESIAGINETAADFLPEIQKIATTFESLASPAMIAKIAAAGAIGATLGSFATNLALQGLAAGAAKLVDLISGKSRRELRWQDFQTAMKAWDEQKSKAIEVEQQLDRTLNTFALINDHDNIEDYLDELVDYQLELEFKASEHALKAVDMNLSTACRKENFIAQKNLESSIEMLEKVVADLNASGIKNGDDIKNAFCSRMADVERQLIVSLDNMNGLRMDLLDGQELYFKELGKEIKKRKGQMRRLNNGGKKLKRKVKKLMSAVDTLQSRNQRYDRRSVERNCKAGEGALGEAVREIATADTDNDLAGRYGVDPEYLVVVLCEKMARRVSSEERSDIDELYANVEESLYEIAANDGPDQRTAPVFFDGATSKEKIEADLAFFDRLRDESVCAYEMKKNQDSNGEVIARCREAHPEIYHLYHRKAQLKSFASACDESYDRLMSEVRTQQSNVDRTQMNQVISENTLYGI